MFLTLVVYFYWYSLYVKLLRGIPQNNTTDVFVVTWYSVILAVYLVQGLMMD